MSLIMDGVLCGDGKAAGVVGFVDGVDVSVVPIFIPPILIFIFNHRTQFVLL